VLSLRRPALLLSLFTLLLVACAAPRAAPRDTGDENAPPEPANIPPPRPPRPLDDDGTFYVETEDPAHPRVRYADGQVALDGSCAIRIGNKLSRRVPPAYVNGQPIGFC
jgi:hypothetical protein